MDDLITITIERRLEGKTFRVQQFIKASMLYQDKEPERLVEHIFRDTYKKFSMDYEMEKDNLAYSPKMICGQPPYNYHGTFPINSKEI